MKTFIVLAFLAAAGFAAETDLRKGKPRYVVMSMQRNLTATELGNMVREVVFRPEESMIKNSSRLQTVLPLNVRLQNHALRFNSGAIAYRGQFPWQAAIVIDDSSFCGGALISNYWVLTAAHCRGNTYYVRLGANRLDIQEYGSLDVTGRYMETYPGYNPTLLLNDIAVIRLSQCVQFTSYIAPARLPNRLQQSETFAGETLRVSGWGIISDSGSGVSPDLAYSDIIGITNYDCTRFYGKAITPSKLCATAFNDDTTCHGDAGGPLVFFDRGGYYILVGIVSFGSKSGCQFGNPVAFSRVTSFLTWIKPYAI